MTKKSSWPNLWMLPLETHHYIGCHADGGCRAACKAIAVKVQEGVGGGSAQAPLQVLQDVVLDTCELTNLRPHKEMTTAGVSVMQR
jgi:hypothetical protein